MLVLEADSAKEVQRTAVGECAQALELELEKKVRQGKLKAADQPRG
jgi:hypothetical protein